MRIYDMLINDQLYDFVNEETPLGEKNGRKYVFFAFPVYAYKYEIESFNNNQNPIKTAVERLSAYYSSDVYIHSDEAKEDQKREGRTTKAECIADDLGLKKELIECVLSEIETERKISEDTGDNGQENDSRAKRKENGRQAKRKENGRRAAENVYILQDRLTGECLDTMIPETLFDSYKKAVDNPYNYKHDISRSSPWHIIVLETSMNEKEVHEPGQTQVEQVLRRNRKKAHRMVSVGLKESFYAVICCYYPKNDQYNFHAVAPCSKKENAYMGELVKRWADQANLIGKLVTERLKEIKPKIDEDDALAMSETEKRLKEELKTLKTTTSTRVVNRLYKLILTYAYFIRLGQKNWEEKVKERDKYEKDVARQDYLIALYTFLEQLFLECLKKNYQRCDEILYDERMSILSCHDEENGELLKNLALDVGFYLNQSAKKLKFKKSEVKKFENINESSKITHLVYWNLLEAVCEPEERREHPFHKIAKENPDFLNFVFSLRKYRNRAKHGSVGMLNNNYNDCYDFAIKAFSIIYEMPDLKLADPRKIDSTEMQKAFLQAYWKAFDMIKSCVGLRKIYPQEIALNDFGKQALFAVISYERKDVEFYAKLSNLYDELLLEIIWKIHKDIYVNTEMVRRFVVGKNNVVDAVKEILKEWYPQEDDLLESQEGEEHKNRYTSFGVLLKEEEQVQLLSVRNKLLYSILCLQNAGDKLRNKSGFSEKFKKMCRQIDSVEYGRGHSNRADFEKDESKLKDMLENALEISNTFGMILSEE